MDLQNKLDDLKIKCRDSYKLAKDNIDGLKTQLDDLFKQLDTTNSPAKDVLNILQKITDLQELDVKINTEKDGTKTARLEERQREAEKDLTEMKKEFSRSVDIFKRAGLKMSAEPLKSDKATSSLLTELKKYLEDKIKQPGEQDGLSKQVLQIVTMQIEVMELMTRASQIYKTQVQIDANTNKLQHINSLLTDLKEQREVAMAYDVAKFDKKIATVKKEHLKLNDELSALQQTLRQLNGQKNEADARKKEMMDKIAKLKDQLVSRILTLQFEFMEAVIKAQGQMNAHEIQINDLQRDLVKEQDKNIYLHDTNDYLRQQVIDREEECADMTVMYTEKEVELKNKVNEMSESTSKKALQIILLGFEIDQTEKQIKGFSLNNDALKEKLDEKIKEVKKKKEEFKKMQGGSDKVLQVITHMEKIWTLQSNNADDLDKISDLQKTLLNTIAELDDNDPTKPMLKILAYQSDATWIREMLKTVTKQAEIQKTALQRELNNKENMLNEKNKELAAGTSNINQLRKEIAALKNEISTLKVQMDEAEKASKRKIGDLEKRLKQSVEEQNAATKKLNEKDATIAQQFQKINNLMGDMNVMKQQMQESEVLVKSRIAGLEDDLMKKKQENDKIREENKKLKQDLTKTGECPELKEKQKKIQAEYDATVSKLNSTILQKVLYIKALIEEVEFLDKKLEEGGSGSDDLINELELKKKQLKEAERKLKANGEVSAKTVNVLQLLTEIWKLQENPTIKNLAKIKDLEQELNDLLSELKTSGEKGLDLALKTISIKESMARLQKAQTKMQEEYNVEINDLQEEIKDKDKEIKMLKSKCEMSAQLMENIKKLEAEASESKNKLKKLQEESEKKIASLRDQLKTKREQLTDAEDRLEETSSDNAALLKKLNNLNEDLKRVTEEKNDALKKARQEITELKELTGEQIKELFKQGLKLTEKDNTINSLQRQLGNSKNEFEKEKEKNRDLETELKTKEKKLANTEDRLKETKAENDALKLKQKQLNEDLDKMTEEKNNLQQKTKKQISELNEKLKRREEELAETGQILKEKDESISTLQKENKKSKAELEKEKDKYNNVINENEKLQKALTEANKVIEKIEEKPKIEWPRLDRNTAHPRLVLSDDEREARTSYLPQSVPNIRERYDTAIAALGKTGFDSGKHYWEVGVAGRKCYIVGMARASAQRKGKLTYGPRGGYWVILKKRDGTHVAIADKEVTLQMKESPSSIGVLVDFKKKEITIYNVDKKLSVFTFTGNENLGTLYPYIETCSDSFNDPPIIFKGPQSTDWILQ
nr:putative leucine-rich repeat-containing protein DDB_G0290503 [Misgurnus anguillicaudatus]